MQVEEESEKQSGLATESGSKETSFPQNTQPITMKNTLVKQSNKLLIPAIALALTALGVSIWLVFGRSNPPQNPSTAPANNATNKDQP
ncbi:MAG: ABC transporter, partial [Pseudanabaena sp.]